MQGVILVSAELAAKGLVDSTAARNAMDADLLVADAECKNAFSVQVKTNAEPASFWLVGEKTQRLASHTHYHALVNLRPDRRHEYFIVPRNVIAAKTRVSRHRKSTWYAVRRADFEEYRNAWRTLGGAD